MVERVFLGWDRPFVTRAAAWLLERRPLLPGIWVVVPTAQSGRRLREELAAQAGAVLAPKVVTPGAFLKSAAEGAAADWLEHVAWAEVLEGITDWTDYAGLFPEPPVQEGDWATTLARELVGLRHGLQENGLLLTTAAWKLRDTVEAERWSALGQLEELVERKIHEWGLRSRSQQLAGGLTLPQGIEGIVLAGVAEMPPLLERALEAWSGSVTALIGAPGHEADRFSEVGTPQAEWSSRPLPWPAGTVKVVADPRQQAIEALRLIADSGTPSDQLAVGTADREVGDELARAFSREGWPTFHPATTVVAGGLSRWFKIWREWLREPSLACLADLLALPETGILVAGKRAQKAHRLAKLRDRWMIIRPEDLRRRLTTETSLSPDDRSSAEELSAAAEALETWRASFLGGSFLQPLR
jgi:ATP-dependent helicase/nuclease subunit B